MKINYDLKFKEELEKIKGTKPSLLLHVCCGPCSGNVLKEISEFFDITIYYSNSNIYPDTEYFHPSSLFLIKEYHNQKYPDRLQARENRTRDRRCLAKPH